MQTKNNDDYSADDAGLACQVWGATSDSAGLFVWHCALETGLPGAADGDNGYQSAAEKSVMIGENPAPLMNNLLGSTSSGSAPQS